MDATEMMSDTPLHVEIEFARHNFENQQSMIRQLDLKAGVHVTLLALLIVGNVSIMKDVAAKLRWEFGGGGLSSAVFVITFVGMTISFISTAIAVSGVIHPRRPIKHGERGRDLLFSEHVLQHCGHGEYYSSLRKASADTLLRNLADQVFELAVIVQAKTKALAAARLPTVLAFGFWLTNVVTALWILTWK